jgi:hypothetical protein
MTREDKIKELRQSIIEDISKHFETGMKHIQPLNIYPGSEDIDLIDLEGVDVELGTALKIIQLEGLLSGDNSNQIRP